MLSSASPYVIDEVLHRQSQPQNATWYDVDLDVLEGRTQFRCFKLDDSLQFTISECAFTHPYYSTIEYPTKTTLLVFGLSGKNYFGFNRDNVAYFVRPGDIWLINVDRPLHRFSPSSTDNRMAVLKVSTTRLRQAFQQDLEAFSAVFAHPIHKVANQQDNMKWIEPLINNPLITPIDRIQAESKALDLVARWLFPLLESPNVAESLFKKSDPLDQVRATLIENLTNPPTLGELARSVGMSHTKLNREFKQVFGKTVFDWLRQYRIELASRMLTQPGSTVSDIAYQCGFSSASHLSQGFRHHFGVTPIEFRRGKRKPLCPCCQGRIHQ
ncbi:helix-turn-helix domain-containing protein [Thaumasiovibrio subtropicus]|uniref:helix-turn-helix domain-containing protein n=1 Tax=Thaumasiovibrio subtropicus TaxID=1891207 RepID=UPI000B35D794|nr:AraC family transcriptional regulator [Thaumasiovibrio subtropicus]